MHFKKFVGVFLIVTIIEEGPLTFRQEPGVPDFLPRQGSVQREEGPESWAQVLSMLSKMKPECMLPTRWVAKRFFFYDTITTPDPYGTKKLFCPYTYK